MSQYRVQNPVNNKIIETFDALDGAASEPILEASSVAFTEWSGTPVSQRAEIVAKAASLFEERKEELAAIIAEEMGKPLPEGVEEAEFSSAIIQYYADNAEKFLADQEIPTEADGKAFIRRRPRVRLEPLISGGGQERGLRSGTLPTPLVVGFGEAARIAAKEMMVR